MEPAELNTERVVRFHETLSNWNRWGPDDGLGGLNYITPEKRRQAAALVHSGRTVSCGRIIHAGSPQTPQSSFLSFSDSKFALEYIGFVYHGPAITHLDSLCHIFHEGKMYNGFAMQTVGLMGAQRSDVTAVRHGIVSRGILLDIPRLRGVDELASGEAIHQRELQAAESAAGVQVGEGDILLVRTGTGRVWREGRLPVSPESFPGCHADCLPWFHERRIAMLGSDAINDVVPSGFDEPVAQPIHWVGMVAMGLHLLDNGDFEDLAEACAEENRWEFRLTVAPLAVAGGTGSPVNPIAEF